MKRIIFLIASIFALFLGSNAQENKLMFPTGMVWKEAMVERDMPFDSTSAVTYEVGADIQINGILYKQILKDGVTEDYFIREADNCVWLLAKEYSNEIKLYDFNWDIETPLRTEYLKESENGPVLCTEKLNPLMSETVTIEGNTYQYISQRSSTTICRIGNITQLNRFKSLLGYKEPVVILPGLIYRKVLWIERDGKRVFQSTSPEEWISYIPETNSISSANDAYPTDNSEFRDLQGRSVTGTPRPGIYIQQGRKRVVK